MCPFVAVWRNLESAPPLSCGTVLFESQGLCDVASDGRVRLSGRLQGLEKY